MTHGGGAGRRTRVNGAAGRLQAVLSHGPARGGTQREEAPRQGWGTSPSPGPRRSRATCAPSVPSEEGQPPRRAGAHRLPPHVLSSPVDPSALSKGHTSHLPRPGLRGTGSSPASSDNEEPKVAPPASGAELCPGIGAGSLHCLAHRRDTPATGELVSPHRRNETASICKMLQTLTEEMCYEVYFKR